MYGDPRPLDALAPTADDIHYGLDAAVRRSRFGCCRDGSGSSAYDPGMRVLELFCGIGGCAAALPAGNHVVGIDQSPVALEVYRHNHPHQVIEQHLVTARRLPDADLWWMSPPCQPYTRKGARRDLDDPRAASLVRVMELVAEQRPRHVAIENVPEFWGSRAWALVRETLDRAGYAVAERVLCPTHLGIPMRRHRWYLVASDAPPRWRAITRRDRPLSAYLSEADDAFVLDHATAHRYRHALDVVDPDGIAACFTAAYGRSVVRSGSYLRTAAGLRRFSPPEIARLMGFFDAFSFPDDVPLQRRWALLGNSLSVDALTEVLSFLPP